MIWMLNRFTKCKVKSSDVAMMFQSLKRMNKLKVYHVGFESNGINDECMDALGDYFDHEPCLFRVMFTDENITDDGIEMFVTRLTNYEPSKRIEIINCKGITDKSVPTLVHMLYNTQVNTIRIISNKTLITDSVSLMTALRIRTMKLCIAHPIKMHRGILSFLRL